jgi:hypothetical protein
MNVSQDGRDETMTTSAHRIVALPLAEAAARLPATVKGAGVALHVDRERVAPGTLVSGSKRYPARWSRGHLSRPAGLR